MAELRMLAPGDEAALDAFLARHADSSMFLRANLRAGGLVDRGAPMQATYAAAIEGGEVRAAAAHCWNGIVLVQAPDPSTLGPVVRLAVARSGRAVAGVSGPWAQAVAARGALGLEDRAAASDSRDILFALDLAELVIPEPLASGAVACRHPRDDEVETLAGWRADYCIELLGARDTPELRASCRADIELLHRLRAHRVLVGGGALVAYSAFNAAIPDAVQVGGVWTPPALRSRGYARSAVAGSLLDARERGVRRAVLFTDHENAPARRAYEALGFAPVGEYALVLYA